MDTATRITLDDFLRRVDTARDLATTVERIHAVTDALLGHLQHHPDLAAQVRRLAETVPRDPATLDRTGRAKAKREALQRVDDLAEKWIAAKDPPLVDQIDTHLNTLKAALPGLTQADPTRLRQITAEIDRLAASVQHLDDADRRYVPWALAGAGLFAIGLGLIFAPSLLQIWPFNHLTWTIPLCLAVLPVVAVHFALRVMPRSRVDTEIDALNRKHFLPHGGLYFPPGPGPGCVMLVDMANHRAADSDIDPRREIRRRWGLW